MNVRVFLLLCIVAYSISEIIVINNFSAASCSGTPINSFSITIGQCYNPSDQDILCPNACSSTCDGDLDSFHTCAGCTILDSSFTFSYDGVDVFRTDYTSSDCSGSGTPSFQTSGGCAENTATASQPCVISQGLEINVDTNSFTTILFTSFFSSFSSYFTTITSFSTFSSLFTTGSSFSTFTSASSRGSSSDSSSLVASALLFLVALLL